MDDDRRNLPRDYRTVLPVARLPPSRRHPEGAPRCQRIIRHPGEHAYQCKRAARRGFPVCGKHGAGFLAREKSGERLSVRSNLRDGSRARSDTLDALLAEEPLLRGLIKDIEDEEFRPIPLTRRLLAMARALADLHVQRANLRNPREIEKAMSLHSKAIDLASKVVTLENSSGVITQRELDRVVNAFGIVLGTYLPEACLNEALHLCLELVTPDDPNVGIPRPED